MMQSPFRPICAAPQQFHETKCNDSFFSNHIRSIPRSEASRLTTCLRDPAHHVHDGPLPPFCSVRIRPLANTPHFVRISRMLGFESRSLSAKLLTVAGATVTAVLLISNYGLYPTQSHMASHRERTCLLTQAATNRKQRAIYRRQHCRAKSAPCLRNEATDAAAYLTETLATAPATSEPQSHDEPAFSTCPHMQAH